MRGFIARTMLAAALAWCGVTLLAVDATAQAVYRYQGRPFKFFSCGHTPENDATISCPDAPAPGNPLTSYLATDAVTAVLSFDTPLPANLPLQDVSSRPGFQLVLSDGRHTVNAPSGPFTEAEVATDAVGQIVAWTLSFATSTPSGAITGIDTFNDLGHAGQPPFARDQGTLACCDPVVHGDLASNQNAPGSWNFSATCQIQLNKSAYVTGDAIGVPVFRLANDGAAAVPIEMKVWLERPNGSVSPVLNSGADGSIVLPAGFTQNVGGFSLGTLTAQAPRGTYRFNCRLLDPATGRLLSQSLTPFVVQ
ncbi:MAG TPA: hypothetical protein VH417_11575 [Vicinamibacterales bacterium]